MRFYQGVPWFSDLPVSIFLVSLLITIILLPRLKFICRFNFSRYIIFAIYASIHDIYLNPND